MLKSLKYLHWSYKVCMDFTHLVFYFLFCLLEELPQLRADFDSPLGPTTRLVGKDVTPSDPHDHPPTPTTIPGKPS